MSETVRIRVALADEDAPRDDNSLLLSQDDLDAALADVPGVDYEAGYENLVDPVSAAIIVGAVLAGAQLVIRLWREWRGGTILDVSKKPVEVKRTRALDYGFFVIIASDGSVKIEAKDEPKTALERLVSDVLGLATGAKAADIKALADKALGDGSKAVLAPATAS